MFRTCCFSEFATSTGETSIAAAPSLLRSHNRAQQASLAARAKFKALSKTLVELTHAEVNKKQE
jgi:hypothetical protein